jgi:molecular chaperone GrpE (heat shock protein)
MSANTRKTKPVKTPKASRKPAAARPRIAKAALPPANTPSKPRRTVTSPRTTEPAVRPVPDGLETLRLEIADLRTAVEKSLSPVASGSMDELDALRRVLSYLFEARTEAIVRELVFIHHAAAGLANGGHAVIEPLEALLADLGAIKFEAERFEHVDPLIHSIVRESQDNTLEDAVIVKTIRPGFRTGRGMVIAKALVMVNRRA